MEQANNIRFSGVKNGETFTAGCFMVPDLDSDHHGLDLDL